MGKPGGLDSTKFAVRCTHIPIGFLQPAHLPKTENAKTTYFADYRWFKGYPKGLAAIDDPNGEAHFRLLEVDGGCRL